MTSSTINRLGIMEQIYMKETNPILAALQEEIEQKEMELHVLYHKFRELKKQLINKPLEDI